jgi:hypothetical protein
MPAIVSHRCINGCVFLKNEDDPMICKCAAEATGKRPPSSEQEIRLDEMAAKVDRMQPGLLAVTVGQINEAVGVVERV